MDSRAKSEGVRGMKQRLLAWSRVGTFVLVTSFSGRALACCNDFWSCAGAVFTGGVSCAVEAAHNAIRDFVGRVERTRSLGEQQMQATTRDLDREAATGCKSEDDRVSQGLAQVSLARNNASAAIDAKAPSLSANVVSTLQKGRAELDRMQAEAKTLKDESAAKLNQAASVRQAKTRDLNVAFHAAFVAPLTGLVAPLITALDPISAAATIAVLADQLSRIEAETGRVIAQGVDAFDAAMNGLVQDLRSKSAAQQKRAAGAQELAGAIQTLTNAPTEANRQRVERLLGNSSGPVVVVPKLMKLNFVAINATKTKTVPAIKSSLVADAAFARKVKVSPTVAFDKNAAERRTQSELDKRLAGKSGDGLETERKKLLAEAAQHFKKDAKSLAAVEKAINAEVNKRKQPMLKLKPTTPLPGPAPIKK